LTITLSLELLALVPTHAPKLDLALLVSVCRSA